MKVYLIDKEMVLHRTNQDLHEICNLTSFLRFNDVKSLFKSYQCWTVGDSLLTQSVEIYSQAVVLEAL